MPAPFALSKTSKLLKSKSTDEAGPASPAAAGDRKEPLLRTTYSDLKDPSTRQLLRRHLTGTFTETAIPIVQDEQQSMPKHRVSSSEGQTPHIPTDLQQLGPSPETTVQQISAFQDGVIDVERTILLLQELRKTATPDELIALQIGRAHV